MYDFLFRDYKEKEGGRVRVFIVGQKGIIS